MSKLNHCNPKYSGGIPLAVGDRYYGQDIFRDFRYQQYINGQILRQFLNSDDIIIDGLEVSQGVGHTIDITGGKSLIKYQIDILDRTNPWQLPPNTESIDILIMPIIDSNLTNIDISGATTDGATTNYVKLKYKEEDGNTRSRVKGPGSYSYEVTPSYEITVNSTPPTAYENTLETFTSNGTTIVFLGNESDRLSLNLNEDIKLNGEVLARILCREYILVEYSSSSSALGTYPTVTAKNTNISAGQNSRAGFQASANNDEIITQLISFTNNSGLIYAIIGTTTNHNVQLRTNNILAMEIDTSQNCAFQKNLTVKGDLGIESNIPTFRLKEVDGNTSYNQLYLLINNNLVQFQIRDDSGVSTGTALTIDNNTKSLLAPASIEATDKDTGAIVAQNGGIASEGNMHAGGTQSADGGWVHELRDGTTESDIILKKKRIKIGIWDMDTDAFKTVSHGVTKWKTIAVNAITIIKDDELRTYPLNVATSILGEGVDGGIQPDASGGISSSTIYLFRVDGEFFDSINFDSTSINRGYVDIEYEV